MTDSEMAKHDTQHDGDNIEVSAGMAACMDKFARSFEASARRWELVVYPSLLAFIVLAVYGFFLIYTLTSDVGRMARSIESMVVSMDDIVTDLHTVSSNMGMISSTMVLVANDVGTESETMKDMLVQMGDMNKSIGVMTVPIYHMRTDMSRINRNMHQALGPMKMMNSIFPF